MRDIVTIIDTGAEGVRKEIKKSVEFYLCLVAFSLVIKGSVNIFCRVKNRFC